MDKNYYEVYLDDNGIPSSYSLICQCLGKVDTRNYGYARVFREIITNKIIIPKYDVRLEDTSIEETITLVYDNTNEKSYQKISRKEVLATLKSLVRNNMDMYLESIEKVEKKQIERVLVRIREEDICHM